MLNFLFLAMAAILIGRRGRRIQLLKGTTQGPSLPSLVQIDSVVSEKKIFNDFLPNFLFLAMAAILVGGRGRRIQLLKGTTQGPSLQSLVQIGPVVSEKKIFNDFLPNFLFLAMAAILVGGRGRRIQLLKGTTQGPPLPSLVQISPVVSEKKIFNDFFLPNFLFLAMAAILVGWGSRRIQLLEGDHPRTIPAKFGPNWST